MTRICIGITALLLLAACAGGPQVTPAVRSELSPAGKLRVGINSGNAALMRQDTAPGELRGVPVAVNRMRHETAEALRTGP